MVAAFIMTTTTCTASGIQKIRRDVTGGKRGLGRVWQKQGRRAKRPNPCRIKLAAPDPSLSSVAGLVPFGSFLREDGVDRELRKLFDGIKRGPGEVYPMSGQLRLLIDCNLADEPRVFGLEGLARDPLFCLLAGGSVPSIDTVYRDLERFDAQALRELEAMAARHGLWAKELAAPDAVHLDLDTTVEPLFGEQEGARPGPNPRYHGRPSYHPIVASVAETRTVVAATLRPGDTGLGEDDVPDVRRAVARVRSRLRPEQALYVRIDAAGDCVEILRAVDDEDALFVVRARMTRNLAAAIYGTPEWRTVDEDDDGPIREVAEVDFARDEWKANGRRYRVIAVRTRGDQDRAEKQLYLWEDLDFTVKAYVTSDLFSDADFLARKYEDRAEVEPLIGELKHALGIGAVPSQVFDANHAMFLVKILTHNLVRRYVTRCAPLLAHWRLPWLRRALFTVPGRLCSTGNRRYLRLAMGSYLYHLRE